MCLVVHANGDCIPQLAYVSINAHSIREFVASNQRAHTSEHRANAASYSYEPGHAIGPKPHPPQWATPEPPNRNLADRNPLHKPAPSTARLPSSESLRSASFLHPFSQHAHVTYALAAAAAAECDVGRCVHCISSCIVVVAVVVVVVVVVYRPKSTTLLHPTFHQPSSSAYRTHTNTTPSTNQHAELCILSIFCRWRFVVFWLGYAAMMFRRSGCLLNGLVL